MRTIHTANIPENFEAGAIYEFSPIDPNPHYYQERTDRNIGWISPEEQNVLKNAKIGIAGMGGMGGAAAPVLLRMGIGHIKLADLETFDVSNINRQFGAGRAVVGKSKVFETVRALRAITDDTTLVAYPRGINQEEVDHFVDGCDLVLDMVEFWALSARIMLHKAARKRGIPVISANPVGMGTRFFIFDKNSCDIEKFVGITLEEALVFEQKSKAGTASKREKMLVLSAVMTNFVPELPFYAPEDQVASSHNALRKRIMDDGKPSVMGCNLSMAGGFLANHVILYLLRNSHVKRSKLPQYPRAPGYIYFDAAFIKAKIRHDGVLVRLRRWIYKTGVKRLAAKIKD